MPYKVLAPDERDLRIWWSLNPTANVGIVLSPNFRLCAVDVDGDRGDELLRQVVAGKPPATLSFVTGRGKRLLFSADAASNRLLLRTPKGEVRVISNGVTVAPPSLHQNGKRYHWTRRHGRLLPAPSWVTSMPSASPTAHADEAGKVTAGNRNATLFRLACSARRVGFLEDGIRAILTAANQICDPPLTDAELDTIARSASKYTPATMAG